MRGERRGRGSMIVMRLEAVTLSDGAPAQGPSIAVNAPNGTAYACPIRSRTLRKDNQSTRATRSGFSMAPRVAGCTATSSNRPSPTTRRCGGRHGGGVSGARTFGYQAIDLQRTRHGCTGHAPLITRCTCLQVSCFGSNTESDAGDDWLVEWETKKQGKTWQQDVPVWYVNADPCCCGRRGKGEQVVTTGNFQGAHQCMCTF